MLVAQDSFEVTIHRRSENWEPVVLTSPDVKVELRSIGLSLTVGEIYEP